MFKVRNIFKIIVCLVILFSFTVSTKADDLTVEIVDTKVVYLNKILNNYLQYPLLSYDNTTYISIRDVAELIWEADIEWDNNENTVRALTKSKKYNDMIDSVETAQAIAEAIIQENFPDKITANTKYITEVSECDCIGSPITYESLVFLNPDESIIEKSKRYELLDEADVILTFAGNGDFLQCVFNNLELKKSDISEININFNMTKQVTPSMLVKANISNNRIVYNFEDLRLYKYAEHTFLSYNDNTYIALRDAKISNIDWNKEENTIRIYPSYKDCIEIRSHTTIESIAKSLVQSNFSDDITDNTKYFIYETTDDNYENINPYEVYVVFDCPEKVDENNIRDIANVKVKVYSNGSNMSIEKL